MKTITMVVEASPDSIGAYSEGDEGIYGMGGTIGECRRSVQDAIDTIKESYPDHQIPEALRGEYQLEWKYDMESLLNYYKGIFTNAAIERLTGINQRQVHHYASGLHRPRPAQKQKVQDALHDLGRELLSIRLA